ncbi:MAG: phage holin family protein [Magnetospiraceae bacterium]
MFSYISPEWQKTITGILGLVPTTFLARFLIHRRLVTVGERAFWSWALLWEVPTAMFCAILGAGLGDYLTLGPIATNGIAGAVAYIGPRGLEVSLSRFVENFLQRGK